MERVSVVGNSGSGKTTFARALAAELGAAHLELDAVFHQPGWQELPVEEFRARVVEFMSASRWVIDGNYSAVQDLVWQRADTVVWLDLPRRRVMTRLMRRTAGRLLLRRRLWNGNREQWANVLSRNPDRSILAWAWTMHATYQARYAAAERDPTQAHLRFVRLMRPSELTSFLAGARAGR